MTYSSYHSSDVSNSDFNVVQYGYRECRPDFRVYYYSCPNYLFHYVYSGKGSFCVKSKTGHITRYSLSSDQAFIIYPGQEVWYTSDSDDPFSYRWIEFFGNKSLDFLTSAHLTKENPIHIASEPYECGKILKQITDCGILSPMRMTGLFWMMADSLSKGTSNATDNLSVLFNNALKYIHDNVSSPTTVEDVAKAIGVSRGYLSKIFSKFIDQSPKQYITFFHISEAKSLLSGTTMNISHVAASVGYDTVSDFTRAFKKTVGLTPSEYKKQHTQN